MDGRTVPVMVDDSKDLSEFQMTRVTYFYVESLEPSDRILFDAGRLEFPVISLEFTGIVYKPLDLSEFFDTPELIEDYFQGVEKSESLYVDSDNLWIPNRLFPSKPHRGEVYRMRSRLFIRIYSLCRDDAFLDHRAVNLSASAGDILFSEDETRAFKRWTDGIVKGAVDAYPKNEKLMARWEE